MTYSMSIANLLAVFAVDTDLQFEVSSITQDSRQVAQGAVFFAYKGHAGDGRDYVLQAQSAGAAAIVFEAEGAQLPKDLSVPAFAVHGLKEMVGFAASAFYGEPSQELQVFGVTGTNGKTTCCYLLTQAFEAMGMQSAMIGTIGVGPLRELKSSGLTTPDAISVQRTLARFRDAGITQVCMEVSSHALDQSRVNGVEFFCTLFTNLSHDHLDYHGDMQSYGLAKQRLFTDFHSELVVTNAADELGSKIIDVANAEFIVQYGVGGDVFADDIELGEDGIEMVIEGNGVEFAINTPLIGKVNVPNIEMLIATLLALSTDVEDIQKLMLKLVPAPGRMELYTSESLPRVVVDYAHTPDALEKALLSIKEHCHGKLWCVFGCGGDRDSAKRAVMGKISATHADYSIVTNDNPRTESPEQIARGIEQGIKQSAHANYDVVLDRNDAIRHAIEQASSHDWVLVAGKGHETTQTIGDQVLPFSDREVVAAHLETVADSREVVS